MRILGIDPGYAIVGYGVVDYDRNRFLPVRFGAITTPADMEFPKRLEMIYNDMCMLLDLSKPDAVAMEKLYFTNNKTTGIDVAQARGVILLAVQQRQIPSFHYTPMQVKQSVVGYGRAEKNQVIQMTAQILSLDAPPKPDDTADALAVAICHGHSAYSALSYL